VPDNKTSNERKHRSTEKKLKSDDKNHAGPVKAKSPIIAVQYRQHQ